MKVVWKVVFPSESENTVLQWLRLRRNLTSFIHFSTKGITLWESHNKRQMMRRLQSIRFFISTTTKTHAMNSWAVFFLILSWGIQKPCPRLPGISSYNHSLPGFLCPGFDINFTNSRSPSLSLCCGVSWHLLLSHWDSQLVVINEGGPSHVITLLLQSSCQLFPESN